MRVTKNSDGTYFVDDEPMRLSGEAGVAFVHAMESGAGERVSQEHDDFLTECKAAYAASKAKTP